MEKERERERMREREKREEEEEEDNVDEEENAGNIIFDFLMKSQDTFALDQRLSQILLILSLEHMKILSLGSTSRRSCVT